MEVRGLLKPDFGLKGSISTSANTLLSLTTDELDRLERPRGSSDVHRTVALLFLHPSQTLSLEKSRSTKHEHKAVHSAANINSASRN